MRPFVALLAVLSAAAPLTAQQLPGTKPLTAKGDLAAEMVAGIDRDLDRRLTAAVKEREQLWKLDSSSKEAYEKSLQPHRERLKKLIGVVDARVNPVTLELVATTDQPALVAEKYNIQVFQVRWPVLPGLEGEGLLLRSKNQEPIACVVVLPDADQTPEMYAGLAPGLALDGQIARQLALDGCLVLVPTLIDRKDTWSGNPAVGRKTNQPHREFIYRMAFEMGRHVIGYEVQKVLAAVDYFSRAKKHPPIGVYGHGEGGLIALYSAALDPRIKAAAVSGYFDRRERLHTEPIYRNVWGLLREFGDAELARMVMPRGLHITCSKGPEVQGPPPAGPGRSGAAPGKLVSPTPEAVKAELRRYEKTPFFKVTVSVPKDGQPADWMTYATLLENLLQPKNKVFTLVDMKQWSESRKGFDPAARQKRQFDQLVTFTQNLLPVGEVKRQQLFAKADFSTPAKYNTSVQQQRDYLWDEIIGKLPPSDKPMNVRTRLVYDEPKWKGYEVVLDLYDDVFCYGILLVPNDLKPGEKRPVVVCQHGLEGRPTNICNPRAKTKYYNSFGARLADRGYVVFAPQNPYIGGNRFRELDRKANPLKLSLYAYIVRQHERILDWLETLPFVDRRRIAFYGLSYGGKVAMRIPALLERYCLSICSGDFNDWVWKCITMLFMSSYMFTGEYEMYEFDLGNTFNYAEMAALIAPRPFMVERGHHDGVGIDERVAYEYAKVRRHYARLKLPERTAIEFFDGGHEIRGQGTFAFLDRHLNWTPPAPKQPVKQGKAMSDDARFDNLNWQERYLTGDLPWDTNRPSAELQRVLREEQVRPCRAVELGCGTGTNSVWLAQQGFDMVSIDLAPAAIEAARKRADAAGVRVDFRVADVLTVADLPGPFAFFFDRGCYHAVRRLDAAGYVRQLDRITAPDAVGLVLTGNANEKHDQGPPVVSEEEIRRELGERFTIERLREFRFDTNAGDPPFLGWSCWLRKK